MMLSRIPNESVREVVLYERNVVESNKSVLLGVLDEVSQGVRDVVQQLHENDDFALMYWEGHVKSGDRYLMHQSGLVDFLTWGEVVADFKPSKFSCIFCQKWRWGISEARNELKSVEGDVHVYARICASRDYIRDTLDDGDLKNLLEGIIRLPWDNWEDNQ